MDQSTKETNIYTQELRIFVQLPGNGHLQPEKGDESPKLQWTQSKAALVELIYGLQTAGAFNNGTADIKQLTAYFEQLFQLELGNVYHVFQEMRIRKKNRSAFIDLLKARLIQRMDEADEGIR